MKKNIKNKNNISKSSKYIVFDKKNEKQKFPHFRKYKKSGHPAMITGEYSSKEWNYRKVMHSEKEGKHLNEKIFPNPNPIDPKPMHVAKRVRHDNKNNFSKWKYNWKIK